ncbi:MAG: hypothetical protein ACYC35_18020 [Pirellulales bacterium]
MKGNLEGFWRKWGVIVRLVEQAPQEKLGRTAIVKLLYLLQEVKGVPLGYDFRLYTYGPFDSEVLNDLETAQSFQALQIKTVFYPTGYGYDVRSGSKAAAVKARVAEWLASHESELAWAGENFASRSASELEIIATIVYVAREFARRSNPCGRVDLARCVRELKPRFSEDDVLEKCDEASNLGLLPSAR